MLRPSSRILKMEVAMYVIRNESSLLPMREHGVSQAYSDLANQDISHVV